MSHIKNVRALALGGKSCQEIADCLQITRQRVSQILTRNLPNTKVRWKKLRQTARQKTKLEAENVLLQNRATRIRLYGKSRTPKDTDALGKKHSRMFIRKRENSKKRGIKFTLKWTDLTFPTHCPVLGLELDYFTVGPKENSPSFDRINSSKGYVKGNVLIVSWRANRLKNNGSPDEHLKIARFYGKLQKP